MGATTHCGAVQLAITAAFLVATAAAAVNEKGELLRVLNCPISAKSFDPDCDRPAYVTRVGTYVLPGIVMAAILFLWIPVYACGKYCCNCCGGSMPSAPFFCGTISQTRHYHHASRLRPKLYATVLVGVGIAFVSWGLTSSIAVSESVSALGKQTAAVPGRLNDEIIAIRAALQVTTYNESSDTSTTADLFSGTSAEVAAINLKNDLDENMKSNVGVVQDSIDQYQTFMYLVLLIPFFLMVVGAVAGWMHMHKFVPMALLWVLLLFGVVVWILHAAAAGAVFVVGDVCAEVRGVALQQKNVMAPLLRCTDALFTDFVAGFLLVEVAQAQATCFDLYRSCYNVNDTVSANLAALTVFDCAAGVTCAGIGFADLTRTMASTSLHANISAISGGATAGTSCNNATGNCTIVRCSGDCLATGGARTAVGKRARQLQSGLDGAETIATASDVLASRFSSCDSIMSVIFAPFDESCAATTNALLLLRESSGFEGIVVIMYLFVMVWGAKRFVHDINEDDDQHDDEDHNLEGVEPAQNKNTKSKKP
jgi:hypothetical protein